MLNGVKHLAKREKRVLKPGRILLPSSEGHFYNFGSLTIAVVD
jgi:hypothetical protein